MYNYYISERTLNMSSRGRQPQSMRGRGGSRGASGGGIPPPRISRSKNAAPAPESDDESSTYSYSYSDSYDESESSDNPDPSEQPDQRAKLQTASELLSKLIQDEKPAAVRSDDLKIVGDISSATVVTKSSSSGGRTTNGKRVIADSEKPPSRSKTSTVAISTNSTNSTSVDSHDGIYCVGFIHQTGIRGDAIPIKIFATNNVAGDRKTWEAAVPSGLKTHCAIYCKTGDAENVVAAWDKLYASSRIPKATMWYQVSKKAVDSFAESVSRNSDYEIVSEAKAKFKKQ